MPKKTDYSQFALSPNALFPIVGMHFRPPAQSMLNAAFAGIGMLLVREPSNPYDSNAIQVHIAGFNKVPEVVQAIRDWEELNGNEWSGWTNEDAMVGYIPRDIADRLAPIMDFLSMPQVECKFAQALDGSPRVADLDIPEWDAAIKALS